MAPPKKSLRRNSEKQRRRETCWLTSQFPKVQGAWLGQSQEARTPSRSPVRVAKTQIFEPLLTASQGDPLTRKELSRAVTTDTSTSVLNNMPKSLLSFLIDDHIPSILIIPS